MSVLTWEQFTDWKAKFEYSPWGEDRADVRQEIFRERLLGSMFGSKEELPKPTYPYREPRITREEEQAMRAKTEAALEWDGTKYVWKK